VVEVTAVEAPAAIEVRLDEEARSGFASIVQQYLEQQLAESAARRRRALRLSGRLGLTATDYRASVTVEFCGNRISVRDGIDPRLDASIAGPLKLLTAMLQGTANPLIEHLRGRLRVSSRLKTLLLPLRVHRLMQLRPERRNSGEIDDAGRNL
jgi:predicted lipid carrier protein YhbT